jgi:hypothetical protein
MVMICHTRRHIGQSAIQYWKGTLHAPNHAFSKAAMDLLLFLQVRGKDPHFYSADGVLRFAGLLASGLAG